MREAVLNFVSILSWSRHVVSPESLVGARTSSATVSILSWSRHVVSRFDPWCHDRHPLYVSILSWSRHVVSPAPAVSLMRMGATRFNPLVVEARRQPRGFHL